MTYYAIFDGYQLMMCAEIPDEKPNELLRVLEVCSMISGEVTYKQIDLETYTILQGAIDDELI
jgi:hypothetical protein